MACVARIDGLPVVYCGFLMPRFRHILMCDEQRPMAKPAAARLAEAVNKNSIYTLYQQLILACYVLVRAAGKPCRRHDRTLQIS